MIHPEASALKNLTKLKIFVTNELKIEPMGRRHRETFLRSCKDALENNAHNSVTRNESIEEALAIRMVKLTQFVLEACPHEHAVILITSDNAALPNLLFHELTAFLKRRSKLSASSRKVSYNICPFF